MTSYSRSRRLRIGALALATAAACALAPLTAQAAPKPSTSPFTLSPIGSYATGAWDEGASEIVAFDARTARMFVVNAQAGRVDVLDARDPARLTRVGSLPTPGAKSVAVSHGVVAVAEQATAKTDPGTVSLFDAASLEPQGTVRVRALPDMVTFTRNGKKVLVANEGKPSGYGPGHVDPEGSVSIIDIARGPHRATVATASFAGFDADALRASGVRISGPGASAAQDLEPEYIALDQA